MGASILGKYKIQRNSAVCAAVSKLVRKMQLDWLEVGYTSGFSIVRDQKLSVQYSLLM